MTGIQTVAAVVILLASSLGITLEDTSLADAQAKNDPIRLTVANTFEPGFPGIEKAQLIQFEWIPAQP